MPRAGREFAELGVGVRREDQVVPGDGGFDAAGQAVQARRVLGAGALTYVVGGEGPAVQVGGLGGAPGGAGDLFRGEEERREQSAHVDGSGDGAAVRVGPEGRPGRGFHAWGVQEEGRGGGPGRVPGRPAHQDRGDRGAGEQPEELRVVAGDRVERGADHARAGQPGLPDQGADRLCGRGVLGQPCQVQTQDPVARTRQRGGREGRARAALVLAEVGQRSAVGERPGERDRVADPRYGVPGGEEIGQPGVGGVVAQEVRGDPVGDAERPAQERSVQVLGQEEAALAERARADSRPRATWSAGDSPQRPSARPMDGRRRVTSSLR